MNLHILAYCPRGHEFDLADAINEGGGLAVVPRKVELVRLPKQRRPQIVESPLLPNYLFAALSPDQWHNAPRELSTVKFIGPNEWRRVRDFAARVEMDYQNRMADLERQMAAQKQDQHRRIFLSEYAPGDTLEILGGVMQGYMATFKRLHEGAVPMIEAEVQLTLMGRPVTARIDPIMARRVAERPHLASAQPLV